MQTDLFAEPIRLVLTDAERADVEKPIATAQPGGHGRLLREIRENGYIVTDGTLCECYRCAWHYGSGGYQARLRVLLRAAYRAGWQPPEHDGPLEERYREDAL